MRRTKTRAGRSGAVAASSSSIDDDISLGASQEEAPTPPTPATDAASSSGTSQRRGGVPSQRNQFTHKYEHSGRTTFQCKFVKVLVFLKKNYNIIYEVIIISLISFIFRFINIEALEKYHWRLNRRWRFHCFNGVRYPGIMNGCLKSMHGLTDLRLVLIYNFQLISNKLLI